MSKLLKAALVAFSLSFAAVAAPKLAPANAEEAKTCAEIVSELSAKIAAEEAPAVGDILKKYPRETADIAVFSLVAYHCGTGELGKACSIAETAFSQEQPAEMLEPLLAKLVAAGMFAEARSVVRWANRELAIGELRAMYKTNIGKKDADAASPACELPEPERTVSLNALLAARAKMGDGKECARIRRILGL